MAEEIIGTSLVGHNKDIRLGHTLHELEILANLIDFVKPKNFIEIGVHEGGLSFCLLQRFVNRFDYYGIEINCDIVRSEVKTLYNDPFYRATLICSDCFEPSLMERIKNLPEKFIYCDGGMKALEIVSYYNTLNVGDCIFTHDFSDGTRQGKGLPEFVNAEVFPKDLEILDNKLDLFRFTGELFESTRITGYVKNDINVI